MRTTIKLSLLLVASQLPVLLAQEATKEKAPRPITLSDIQVTGSAPSTPVDNTALKLPAALHETPRSVTVIDSEAIEQRNMKSVNDAYESAPGFFANSRSNEGYHFIARGFRMLPGNTMVDGFNGLLAGGGQKALTLYGIESVSLLGGPANLIYGQANLPGGMVNLTTKKAQLGAPSTLTLTTQTYAGNGVSAFERNGLGLELDHNGSIGKTPFRFGYAADNTNGYVADTLDRTRYYGASTSIKFGPNDNLSLTPLVHRWETITPAGSGMIASATSSLSNNDGSSTLNAHDLSPLDVNLYGGGRRDNITLAGFDFQASGDPTLKLNANYRFIHFDADKNEWSPKTLTSGGIMTRQQTKTQTESDAHNFDTYLTVETASSKDFKNRLLVGMKLVLTDARNRSADGPLTTAQSPIDIYTGQLTGAGLNDVSTGWKPYTLTESTQWNGYLQDQASLLGGKFVLTGGLGYGQFSKEGFGTTKSDVTPNIAAMWNFNKDLSAYVSYDRTFQYVDPAVAYEDSAGNSINPAPTTGDSREIGVKYQLPDQKGNVNAALFSARRQNVLEQSATGVTNLNGNRYYTLIPGQEAHGLELSGTFRVTKDWSLESTFAWIRGSYNETALGDTLAKTPEYSFSLNSRWDHGQVLGRGKLSTYAGLVWQDERLSGNGSRTLTAPDPIMLPAFTRVDVGAEYAVNDKFRVSLHVRNLLDRRIFVDGTTGSNLQVEAPRTITLRATYSY
jgi:outer membrane receptor protein involved in Fe transport